ncbi:TetR/AcrR family transcriptional regulator [Pendulispora brunnea]|uniref:TetR/AcrR family transcriptional regulator n=1 Tax=Pendulispora brunnea TaxID=2905690 RepID=A0ABZ2K689_9BACT
METNPRKRPRQARSQATVDALMDALAQVLTQHGYDGTTTARVAERAGVSIGSLYQYFPNKEALVAALIEHHATKIVADFEEALAGDDAASFEDALRVLARTVLGMHRIAPALHGILNEQVPRVGRIAEAMAAGRGVEQVIERLLNAHRDRLAPGRDPARAARVIATALEALVHKAVNGRPELLPGLEDEVHALLVGYLLRR